MCYSASIVEIHGGIDKELSHAITKDKRGQLKVHWFVSAFDTPKLSVVTDTELTTKEWGLINSNAKDDSYQTNLTNAKGETVFEKEIFKSIYTKRCLFPVTGFFEFQHNHTAKIPYHISVKGQDLFCLGCIYDSWYDTENGIIRETFSIITTEANQLMSEIHNTKKRMPLILPREDYRKWINPDTPIETIKGLVKPFPNQKMTAYTVSTLINNSRNKRDVPEAIKPVNHFIQGNLF